MNPVQVHIHIQIHTQAAASEKDFVKAAQRARWLRRVLEAGEGTEITVEEPERGMVPTNGFHE